MTAPTREQVEAAVGEGITLADLFTRFGLADDDIRGRVQIAEILDGMQRDGVVSYSARPEATA
ncbi:hypothetical protein [Actinoplanes sp. URMC 104]|uniref:hypothetical protein n=1 Tax=Actinoplanes sp. URMC 104 TaxID=3423409 RepID=UPI003F1AD41A